MNRAPHNAEQAAVTAVVPAYNAAGTLDACLSALAALRDQPGSPLTSITVVNDHSTDSTADIAARHNATVLNTTTRGPGAARNTGWRSVTTPLVWFVDADCIPAPDALAPLMDIIAQDRVGGVSGTYANAHPHSLLATLIDEEIAVRHARMPERVDFLATFNVLYRVEALQAVNGFNEHYRMAEDADLAFRVAHAGYELGFTTRSVVAHHHETRLLRHLRTQLRHGYWRYDLHTQHAGHAAGDSYSSLLDHAQPPTALLCAALSALAAVLLTVSPALAAWAAGAALLAAILLAAMQLPMAAAIYRRRPKLSSLAYVPMSMVRSLWRGVGFTHAAVTSPFRPRTGPGTASA